MMKSLEASARNSKDTQAARALATVLHHEFGVVVRVFDRQARLLWPQPSDAESPADSEERMAVATSGQIQLTSLPLGGFRVRLPQRQPNGQLLLAEADFATLAKTSIELAVEQSRLKGWVQSVFERLNQAEALRSRRNVEDDLRRQLKFAWELNLTLERSIRQVRVRRDPADNQQQILKAALPYVGAEALIWVTHQSQPVVMLGAPVLAAEDAQSLVNLLRKSPELRESSMFLCNDVADQPWSARFAAVRSVLILSNSTGKQPGWVLAVNKLATAEGATFRHADAAALAPFAALLGLSVRAGDRYQELKELLVGLTRALASAVDAKDPYTYGHSERVARIAIELGRELGISDDELSDLYLAGLLHDVGKIGIRDEVLCKHGKLTDEEAEHMRQHPVIGHAILKDLRQLSSLLPGVLHHHERFDGKGYPHRLAGEQIPLLARILAVADSYDAMSTTRPYRSALSPSRVEQILAQGANQQWDGRVLAAFERIKSRLRTIRERGLGESLRQALDGALRDNGSSRACPKSLVVPRVTA